MEYTIVVEQEGNSVGIYSEDFPGCVSVGDSIPEALEGFADALRLYESAKVRRVFTGPDMSKDGWKFECGDGEDL